MNVENRFERIETADSTRKFIATDRKPSAGDVIQVTITNINESIGAFAMMPNGIVGLIRVKDFAWCNQHNILKSYSAGDTLDVEVIYEMPDGKLNLSRKALLPNPRAVEIGDILEGVVERIESYGLIVRTGDFTVLIHRTELPQPIVYREGDKVTSIVIGNEFITEKGYNKISTSILALHDYVAKMHNDHEIVTTTYVKQVKNKDNKWAIVELDSTLKLHVPEKCFINPYQERLLNNSIPEGEELDFEYRYDERKRIIELDMRPLEQKKQREEAKSFLAKLQKGEVVEAVVVGVNDKAATVRISNTNLECSVPRERLSPNKVIRASDEVFVGEHIKLVYIGDGDNLAFSRKDLIEDRYDENLYDLSLQELLTTMDLTTNKFVGKVIEIKTHYFLTNLMTVGESDYLQNGKLLTNPINGKNLFVIVNDRLKEFFEVGEYYEVELDLEKKTQRTKEGTPYMFRVNSNNIKKVENPYRESVSLAFSRHISPTTNTDIANLLEEVGENLYSSKKRMFFELLQNADDAAPECGVRVKLQLNDQYFVFTHDGFSFNQHDLVSITSAAKSTKIANDKKTGYKGIGFKSVFTNSQSVYISTGGYNFAFDKKYPRYDFFEDFYFFVNDIGNDKNGQEKFLKKYQMEKETFEGVRHIPWQLLPIWCENKLLLADRESIFSEKENVSIALKMAQNAMDDYNDAIKEVFDEPRFMLFLRNTTRVQWIRGNECFTIQKNKSADGKTISLVNSFNPDNREENYTTKIFEHIEVSDEAFRKAGVLMKREERTNKAGLKENYYVKVDADDSFLGEVSGIPDRIASATQTTISIAVKLDTKGKIAPLTEEALSLYAYLPMNEHRFKFPFYINADFIPKSDREGLQSDNPWNHFIFYTIGKCLVEMVATYASTTSPEYLNLLPEEEFKEGQDTSGLATSFNRGYKEALEQIPYIINTEGELVHSADVVYDDSGLSEAIGANAFYSVMGTDKRLPNSQIKYKCLSHALFGVEKYSVDDVLRSLRNNISTLFDWIMTSTEAEREKFYKWIVYDEKTKELMNLVPMFLFGDTWKSIEQIQGDNKSLILKEELRPISGVLSLLGFEVSNSTLESHPLHLHISSAQDEKEMFLKIQGSNVEALPFTERLNLFKGCAKLEGVGKETLRKWSIFKNQNGEFTPLLNMFAYNATYPEWLQQFMLKEDEQDEFLSKYLIPAVSVYSEIIEKHIDSILSSTDILEVYQYFKTSWTSEFTTALFSKQKIEPLSMLGLVEKSDINTKAAYVKKHKKLELESSSSYDDQSFEHRWIKLALTSDDLIEHAKSIITIDGNALSTYTIKDDISITYNNIPHKFVLSKLSPSFDTSHILNKVVSQFASIYQHDKIFAQSEAAPEDVYKTLYVDLNSSQELISEEQFCFLMVYLLQKGQEDFGYQLSNMIRANDESLFLRILEKTLEMGLGNKLREFIKKKRKILFPFEYLIGTYFKCDEYTLPCERTPQFITNWADTPKKEEFLIELGLYNDKSKEIVRRKAFKDKDIKNKEIWTISSSNIIKPFIKWVIESEIFPLPIFDETQVAILEPLFTSLRIEYHEEDFFGATEWAEESYIAWKKEGGMRIYIVEGELPYRGIFDGRYVFKGYAGDYKYFESSRTLYISSSKESKAVLMDVYSDYRFKRLFTEDDWNRLFLVSADIVKELNERIAELERENEELKAEGGNIQEEGAIDPGEMDQKSQAEANREARHAAKKHLESIDDFDCSEWDPDEGYGLVKEKVKYKGEPITIAVVSTKMDKLYLHASWFAELMTDPDNRLLFYGADKEVRSVVFDRTFKDNENINLIFDTDVVTPKEFAFIANRYRGTKNTRFAIENISYSASKKIDGFGLKEKKTGEVYIPNDDDDDIFNL